MVLFPWYVLGRGRWDWGRGRTGAWAVPSRLAKYNTESMGITVAGMARGGGGAGEPHCPRLDGLTVKVRSCAVNSAQSSHRLLG